MSYDSTEDFRNSTDEINTASLKQGIHSNNDRNKFVKLIPKRFLNLIENDTFREGFDLPSGKVDRDEAGFDENENSNCDAFCGPKSPICKDIRDGRTVCEVTINLDTKQKC